MAASLDDFAGGKLAALEARALRRRLVETDRREGATATRGGRELISFCCNDYLNLSQHPVVKRAAIEATEKYGAAPAPRASSQAIIRFSPNSNAVSPPGRKRRIASSSARATWPISASCRRLWARAI